jgi:hypothetical protein
LPATQHGVPYFPDLEGFLDAYKSGDLEANAIILATPTHTHIPMAKVLVGSSLAVFIEKPLAPTGAEGRQFLEICKADARGVYMVGHHRRHNCYVRAIKDVLDRKDLGRVVAVNGGETNAAYPCGIGSTAFLIFDSSLGAAQIRSILRYSMAPAAWFRWSGTTKTSIRPTQSKTNEEYSF